ncbi:14284_t:CDS:1, partial [Gigaspora rosea]
PKVAWFYDFKMVQFHNSVIVVVSWLHKWYVLRLCHCSNSALDSSE